MIAIESVACIIGYFDVFRHWIGGKHLNNVEYQVFRSIYVCMDTHINMDIQRCPDK